MDFIEFYEKFEGEKYSWETGNSVVFRITETPRTSIEIVVDNGVLSANIHSDDDCVESREFNSLKEAKEFALEILNKVTNKVNSAIESISKLKD